MARFDFTYPLTYAGVLLDTLDGACEVEGRPHAVRIYLDGVGKDAGKRVELLHDWRGDVMRWITANRRSELDEAIAEAEADVVALDRQQARKVRAAE